MEKRRNPYRKNIRLKDFDYSSAGYYFVTIVRDLVGAQHAKPLQTKIHPLGVVAGSYRSAVSKRIHALGLIDQKMISSEMTTSKSSGIKY